jgi:outer membrane protein assembly factor BamB
VPLLSTNSTSIQILRGGGPAEDYEQKLRDAPKGKEEREPMIYACLDGAATDPCHNHMNMLQLLIWGKGAWLADDNGCRVNWLSGTYDREVGTYNYKTYAHNTVTVDQLPQYIANSTPLFFGSQPGFRIAAMDAGHVYDGVYHQRTVAMTDQYIVDMNLLPPRRDAPAGTTHTFDYLFQGTGRFDLAAMKFSTPYANDWQHQGADGRGLDEYLRWPNLTFIYPFINWSTPGKTSGHWDLTWGLPDGPSLRVVVLNDKPINVAYGMAQLGIRGPSTFDALVLGVPKILARQTGPEARFLTLLEPFRGQSQIATYARLDDQAARVELGDGTKDFILLQRQMPSHVFLRVRDGRLAAARFFAGSNLTVGGKALLQTTAPVHAAGVLFRDGKAYVSASTDKACLLSVACEGEVSPGPSVTKDAAGFRIALQPGDARFAVSGTNLAGPTLADSALATLATENPPRPPAEVGGDYALDRAKRLWQEPYIHPQVYHDGAYKGLKGADSHWSVDVTDDGKVVTGTHFGTVECFDAAGHKLWAYVADGRCAWNIGWNAWYHHRPLHISSDGARVIAGSEFGTVHFLDGEGRYLWKKNLGSRITDICPDSSWTRFAIATEKGIAVLDRDGNTSVELQTGGMVYGIRMADDGSFAARLTRKVDASPAAAAVIAGTTSRETVVIASFDPSGRERWFVNSPPTLRTGRSLEAQAIASSPLNGHRFAAFDMTPDGQRIAAASSNTRLYAFDGRSGKMLWETGLHDTSAAGLRISADARTVYAYGIGGVVLACTGDGKMLWRYRTTFGGYSLDATPDGGRVCVPNATGDVTILARDKKVITRSPVHTVEPMGVAISPNGRYFAVGGVGYDLLLFENRE